MREWKRRSDEWFELLLRLRSLGTCRFKVCDQSLLMHSLDARLCDRFVSIDPYKEYRIEMFLRFLQKKFSGGTPVKCALDEHVRV